MTQAELSDLADEVEAAAGALDAHLAEQVSGWLKKLLPEPVDVGQALGSTDGVLAIVDAAVPGWHIHLEGRARMPNGHWSCQLRHADFRDNDEVIGFGRAPRLDHALLAAVLRIYAYRLR